MSNEEHLIENALTFLATSSNPREALNNKRDMMMADQIGITLDQVWLMAQHIFYTMKPIWEQEAVRRDRAWDPVPDFPSSIC